MSARRKIAEWLRSVARVVDDTPRLSRTEPNKHPSAMPSRRISRTTGTAEYFDDRAGGWVPWREWLAIR